MPDIRLKEYIENEILPRYDGNDPAHGRPHIMAVIKNSFNLVNELGLEVDENMVYAIAAYHDIGIQISRETHELTSAALFLEDEKMREWFSDEQRKIMAEAIEDHRASRKERPRSIYGCIVAEADRDIDPDRIIERSVQFEADAHPGASEEECIGHVLYHIEDKYGENGYLKLWIASSRNQTGLETLRKWLREGLIPEKCRQIMKGDKMAVRILVIGKHSEETRQKFLTLPGSEVSFAISEEEAAPEDLAEAEIIAGDIGPAIVENMPKLKFVQLFSAGANNYSWLPGEITLANIYNAYGDIIAEHMLTVTLMAMKRMPEYVEGQAQKRWELLCNIDRFSDAKILSVGMGAIGTSFLEKSAALGAECYGVRRTVHDKPDFVKELVALEDMDRLLPEMDVVALSLPGTDEVKDLFDEKRLRLMKKTAILVNTGRGNCVVTEDLIRVMEDGHLKAACLDVMNPEPLPEDHPLWTAPRVYITPHVSGGYRAGVNYDRVVDAAVLNIELVLQGRPPVHIVDRKLGY